MNLLPFNKILAMSKEAVDEAMAPIRARSLKAKADLEMSKLDAQILTMQTKIQEKCSEKDIDLPSLIDDLDRVAILERKREQYKTVLNQLFPRKK